MTTPKHALLLAPSGATLALAAALAGPLSQSYGPASISSPSPRRRRRSDHEWSGSRRQASGSKVLLSSDDATSDSLRHKYLLRRDPRHLAGGRRAIVLTCTRRKPRRFLRGRGAADADVPRGAASCVDSVRESLVRSLARDAQGDGDLTPRPTAGTGNAHELAELGLASAAQSSRITGMG